LPAAEEAYRHAMEVCGPAPGRARAAWSPSAGSPRAPRRVDDLFGICGWSFTCALFITPSSSCALFIIPSSSCAQAEPRNANHYVNLAGVVGRGNVTGAIELLQQGLTLNPRFAEAYNNLANFQREAGDLRSAADAYAAAVKLLPVRPATLGDARLRLLLR
jgi:tetratricopeptide (TPR) repeat protein